MTPERVAFYAEQAWPAGYEETSIRAIERAIRQAVNEALEEAEKPIRSEVIFWLDCDDARPYKACVRMLDAVCALKLPEEP